MDSAAARWERGEIVHAQVDFGVAELMPDPDRPSAWTLSVDYVLQSYVDIEDPTRLELPYTVWLARLADFHWPAGRPISAVHVGGGGFSVPRYLAVTRPGSTQTVFDPDVRLVEFLRENLDTDPTRDLTVLPVEGQAGIVELPDASAELLILDAYIAGDGVAELVGIEFLREAARVLVPGGVCAANLWDTRDLKFFRRGMASATEVFPYVAVLAPAGVLAKARAGNLVIAASTEPLPVERLTAWARADGGHVRCLDPAQVATACGTARPLSAADPLAHPVPNIMLSKWDKQ